MIGFGPQEIGQDVLWAVNVYDKSQYTKEQIVSDLGKQFPDRVQNNKMVSLGALSATEIITTTPSSPDWYLDVLLVENDSSYITISNGAINDVNLQKMQGVPSGTTFKDFYSSFKFN
jgi:ornithine cyclodeaminase/alanine dehydrogenase-like protein (mu-crystallin family)